jgi:plasmid stabilization system protein ParE
VNYRANIREDAEADIEEAAVWYEQQREGLGDEFLDEILLSLEIITDNPYLYAEIHRQTRRAMIHRFPFGIYYRIKGELVIVVAVMHGSRHPKRWYQRI